MTNTKYASMETDELVRLLEETEEELYDEDINLYKARTLGEQQEELKLELASRGYEE